MQTQQARQERRSRVLNAMAEAGRDPLFRCKMFRAKVGGQLASAVAARGTTAAALARRSGMKPSQLSKQLSGDCNLTLDSIYRIAEAAGISVNVTFDAATAAADTSISTTRTTQDFQRHVTEPHSTTPRYAAFSAIQTLDFSASAFVNRVALANVLAHAVSHMPELRSTYQEGEAANEPMLGDREAQFG